MKENYFRNYVASICTLYIYTYYKQKDKSNIVSTKTTTFLRALSDIKRKFAFLIQKREMETKHISLELSQIKKIKTSTKYTIFRNDKWKIEPWRVDATSWGWRVDAKLPWGGWLINYLENEGWIIYYHGGVKDSWSITLKMKGGW